MSVALLLLGRLLLAAVFGFAGLTKLLDRIGTRRAIADFGLPGGLTALVAVALPLVELVIAGALIPLGSAWWGAVAALTLLAIFLVGIGVNLARGRRPNCHCFGQLHSAPVGWRTVMRNVALAAVAAGIVWQGRPVPGASAVTWLSRLAPFEVAALLAVLLAAVAWLAVNLLRQQGRLLLRIEALEQHGGQARPALPPPALGLPVGSAAPEFALPALGGEPVTLQALRAGGAAVH
jgi:hypothetical protein